MHVCDRKRQKVFKYSSSWPITTKTNYPLLSRWPNSANSLCLLAYIYHLQSGSGPEYHYTATDLLMAALVIIPGLIVWVSVLFAQPITDSIATWWAVRKERKRQRTLA